MTRDGFVFYRSFYEALKCLPPEEFKKCMVAILEYGLNGIKPETDGFEKSIYLMAKPQIDKNNKRYLNGTKGGRPETKLKPNDNQTETEVQPKEKDKEKDKDKDIKENTKRKVFSPPTVDDVRAYCTERNNRVDPQTFVDFYESKGWMIGKNKMKDWKAAVRTWERETKTRQGVTAKLTKNHNNFERRVYDMGDLERQLMEGQSNE